MTVRRTLFGVAVTLSLLPLAFLALSFGYESWLMGRYHRALSSLEVDVTRLAEEGRRHKVELRLLDEEGRVIGDSHSDALSPSLIGGVTEELLEHLEPHAPPPETLPQLEAALPPLAARPEVQRALAGESAFVQRLSASGHTVVVTLAVPRPGGGVLVLTKGSRRGVRRLLLLRDELCKLLLYQLILAVAFALVAARGLAHPLERLAFLVRRFPHQPLADPKLLGRSDEIGELARAVRQMAEDLEARRRATAELGADVAHELKNPLATIAASAELMADHPDRVALAAPHILQSVERLRRSIDALLALLRLEESLPDEPRLDVEYPRLVDGVLDEYRRDARYAGVTFTAEIEIGRVRLAPAAWTSLLRNLLDNALVQPAATQEVIVSAGAGDGVWWTRVRDFGPGVSPGNRDKLFRRFYSRRPAGAPPGTGLGLSIVQAVAAAHGGGVVLEDVHPGACFCVTATTLPSPVLDSSSEEPDDLHIPSPA